MTSRRALIAGGAGAALLAAVADEPRITLTLGANSLSFSPSAAPYCGLFQAGP